MKRFIFVVMLLCAELGSYESVMAFESPGELARACQKLEAGIKGRGDNIHIPGSKEALLCWGYMRAIQDIAMLVDQEGRRLMGACAPEDSRLTDLIHAFVDYAQSHRDELAANTAVTVIRALQQAYPCRESGAAPKP
jgi:hypothetical protein